MDLAELQALDRAARTAAVEIDGRRFTLLLPKQGQIDDALGRALEEAPSADVGTVGKSAFHLPVARVNRMLLLDAVTGWEGVTFADLVDGCEPNPAPFSRGHLQLLVDDGRELGASLRAQFANLVADRRKRVEEMQKNSASA